MNNIPKNACILPWIHLEAKPDGNVSPCCLNIKDIPNVNLLSDNIEDAWNSSFMESLRESFKNNEKPESCERCWNVENTGGVSKRMEDNKKFENYFHRIWNNNAEYPIYLDLKLGNICNLKCRICNSKNSSLWLKDELEGYGNLNVDDMSNEKINKIKIEHSHNRRWPEKNDEFWLFLHKIMPYLEHIDFSGGEPFLIKHQFDFIQSCIDKGYSKNITLHYNTNGTKFPSDYYKLWENFKWVVIMLSIDGIEERFNYIRYPGNWKNVYENIQKFKEIDMKNYSLPVCHTVSNLNIYYLDEFIEWIEKENLEVFLNILHGPKWYNIKYLPYNVKEKIYKKLFKKANQRNDVDKILSFMMDESNININNKDYYFNMFFEKTFLKDKKQNQNFKNTFSEYANILGI